MTWPWFTALVLYLIAVIVAATLFWAYTRDNPDWYVKGKTSTAAGVDRVVICVLGSLFWPITLLVLGTLRARAGWLAE